MRAQEIWRSIIDLPPVIQIKAYTTCEAGKSTRCVLARFTQLAAEKFELSIRMIRVYNGCLWYSQDIDGEWRRLKHAIDHHLLQKIDEFDTSVKRFKLPKGCPLGPPIDTGKCVKFPGTKEDSKEANKRNREAQKNGTVKNQRSTKRALQSVITKAT